MSRLGPCWRARPPPIQVRARQGNHALPRHESFAKTSIGVWPRGSQVAQFAKCAGEFRSLAASDVLGCPGREGMLLTGMQPKASTNSSERSRPWRRNQSRPLCLRGEDLTTGDDVVTHRFAQSNGLCACARNGSRATKVRWRCVQLTLCVARLRLPALPWFHSHCESD